MSVLPIRPYERLPAAFHPWDPRTIDVARELARLIASARPGAVAEHVGSTAVPGLPGKNIVDLGIEAVPDDIPPLVDALRSLGFQPQGGLAPFPPTRPMLVGAVLHAGEPFRIHCHVMPPARRELAEQRAFRDALRADDTLRDAYAAAKRRIVTAAPAGESNQLYTMHKSGFIQDALFRLRIRRGPVDAPTPLPPGATIGVMGGGQLGLMLGLAARAMGFRLVAQNPAPACPAAAVADEIIVGRYDDADAARRLASVSDVVTWELEHVSLEAAAAAGEIAPLRPGLAALCATQDRLVERRFVRELGERSAPWSEVRGVAEAEAAAEALGYPVRIKLSLGGLGGPHGYGGPDGLGSLSGRSQARATARGEIAAAVGVLGGADGRPLLLEREIDFEAELSVVCARGRDGRTLAYPVSGVHPVVAHDASETADWIARGLDLVGVLTVELFQLRGGGLMINELAPGVHSSGNWTIAGSATSQFEQHVRAIAGLPLGSVRPWRAPGIRARQDGSS